MASAKLLLIVATIGATFSIIAASIHFDELYMFEPYLASVSSKRKELYHYKYSNHIYYDSEEKGILLNPGTEQEEFVVIGRYTQYYGINPVNHAQMRISVYYIADKNGYRPKIILTQWLSLSANSLKAAAGK